MIVDDQLHSYDSAYACEIAINYFFGELIMSFSNNS